MKSDESRFFQCFHVRISSLKTCVRKYDFAMTPTQALTYSSYVVDITQERYPELVHLIYKILLSMQNDIVLYNVGRGLEVIWSYIIEKHHNYRVSNFVFK